MKIKRPLLLLLSVLLLTNISLASGKITGKIIDKETKEPLIGANVIIKDLAVGARDLLKGILA